MISLYLLCFILLVAGTFLILELTPETVTDDIMHMVVPEQTLRDKVLIAQKRRNPVRSQRRFCICVKH